MTPQESKELEKISATSNVLMEKMNEIIWTLNSRNDTLPNLIAYLRHQIVEFFEPLPVRLQLTVPDRIPEVTISGKARRNITLSVKEALHNIVKHSRAAEVSIAFTVGEFFTISIKDNGIGFNPDDTRILSNGIRNMKERLDIIGGSCQIINGEGTLIILSIPLG
jgi:signal transduction histidine kinase